MFIFYLLLVIVESDHFKILILYAFFMKYLLVYLFLCFFSLGSCSTAADSFQVYCAIILLGVGAAHLEKYEVIVVTIWPFSG